MLLATVGNGVVVSAFFVAAVLITTAVSKYLLDLRNPLRHIPGPFYAKFSDLMLAIEGFRGSKLQYLHNLNKKYGPVVRIGPNNVLLGDPDDIKRVLSNHKDFNKGPWFQDRAGPPALITSRDAKHHSARRRIFGSMFSNTEVHKFEPVVRKKVDLAINRIGEESNRLGEADALKWFTFMAADVIGDLCFGDSFRMLESGTKHEFITALERIMMVEAIRLDLPWLHTFLNVTQLSVLFGKLDLASWRQFGFESLQRLRQMLLSDQEEAPPNFFAPILEDEKQKGMTQEDLTNQATEFLFAGSDTTSTSLTYLLWAVLSNPSIQTRLVAEVATLSDKFRDQDLEKLPYLNAVLSETLRLYGPASGDTPREVSSPAGTTFQGYHVPYLTELDIQTHTLHRSPKYHPNPEQFDPERWLNPESKTTEKAYHMPFGGSSRICLGIHLAYMEMRLVIANFFRRYPNASLTGRTTVDDMELVSYAVNNPRGRALYIKV